jgi:hypothetical protein
MRGIRNAFPIHILVLSAFLSLPLLAGARAVPPEILDAAQAGKLLPSAVFFGGQSAPTQLRNSAGVRFIDARLALAVLVDSSGYSSGIQQKYQGYLLTEVALDFAGHRLPPGAYGIGMVQGKLYVMDIGNHGLFQTAAMHDATMHRPVPLQILAGSSPGTYRLCFGRDCVDFQRAQ